MVWYKDAKTALVASRSCLSKSSSQQRTVRTLPVPHVAPCGLTLRQRLAYIRWVLIVRLL